jgi:hypothetical protein
MQLFFCGKDVVIPKTDCAQDQKTERRDCSAELLYELPNNKILLASCNPVNFIEMLLRSLAVGTSDVRLQNVKCISLIVALKTQVPRPRN